MRRLLTEMPIDGLMLDWDFQSMLAVVASAAVGSANEIERKRVNQSRGSMMGRAVEPGVAYEFCLLQYSLPRLACLDEAENSAWMVGLWCGA